ncbi:gliding motility protein GldD [Parabacteroides sp. PF5-6]|uniref:gliding motility lipoprotein GldD n=1 Tax=Parabacteroides sp. PF5-6 TaxID=1742403 RepID=UPI002407368F|nr:gliding motility protein GldD [Parabacteroides sp. PF5-6]MDF9830174.1 gliding motility-associated lipoprotein GldD [Parabacteroides sp. PF5-6]
MKRLLLPLILLFGLCMACADYTPKPRGYMRIEPGTPRYTPLPLDDLPYRFDVSHLTTVELPPAGSPEGWINIAYPSLNARIYCSYLSIDPAKLEEVERETLSLLSRQAKAESLTEQTYENADERVYGSLFILEGEAVSPIQFILTDSLSHFFRGALYYEMRPNVDSLAPVTRYLQEDIVELMQTFHWRR